MPSWSQGPSTPAAWDVTWDKQVIITLILGICPDLLTPATGPHLLQFPVAAEVLLHTMIWTLLKGTPSPSGEWLSSLVFNLYMTDHHRAWGSGLNCFFPKKCQVRPKKSFSKRRFFLRNQSCIIYILSFLSCISEKATFLSQLLPTSYLQEKGSKINPLISRKILWNYFITTPSVFLPWSV